MGSSHCRSPTGTRRRPRSGFTARRGLLQAKTPRAILRPHICRKSATTAVSSRTQPLSAINPRPVRRLKVSQSGLVTPNRRNALTACGHNGAGRSARPPSTKAFAFRVDMSRTSAAASGFPGGLGQLRRSDRIRPHDLARSARHHIRSNSAAGETLQQMGSVVAVAAVLGMRLPTVRLTATVWNGGAEAKLELRSR